MWAIRQGKYQPNLPAAKNTINDSNRVFDTLQKPHTLSIGILQDYISAEYKTLLMGAVLYCIVSKRNTSNEMDTQRPYKMNLLHIPFL